MNLFIRVTLIVFAVLVGLLATSDPASAKSGCLKRADFHAVERTAYGDVPMPRLHVHWRFGVRGRVVHEGVQEGHRHETRVYEGCGERSRVWVEYRVDDEGTYRVASTAFTWRYFGVGLETLHPARGGSR